MLCCDRCKTTFATTYHTSADGQTTLCQSCSDLAENEKIAAEKARLEEAQRPIREKEQKARQEERERDERRPRDHRFCRSRQSHSQRPAAGLDARGVLCCEECLPPELNPAKLAERLAALEQAVAALQAGKPTVKGKAAG